MRGWRSRNGPGSRRGRRNGGERCRSSFVRPERRRGTLARRFGPIGNCRPIAAEQRLLLGTRPRLDPPFGLERLYPGRKIFAPHQADRPTPRCKITKTACLMFGNPPLEVVRMTSVIFAVSASEDIDPKRQSALLATVPRLRSGRTDELSRVTVFVSRPTTPQAAPSPARWPWPVRCWWRGVASLRP